MNSPTSWHALQPGFDPETQTCAIKAANSRDLATTREIMQRIYDEDPSYWPYGISPEHCDGGAYLIRKSGSFEPVGFAGWQEREREGKRIGFYAIGILPEYRGQHFAKRAVDKLIQAKAAGVDEVRAFIMPHNTASIGLADALGVPVVFKSASLRALLARAAGSFRNGGNINAFGKGVWNNKGTIASTAGMTGLTDYMAHHKDQAPVDGYRWAERGLNAGGYGAGAALLARGKLGLGALATMFPIGKMWALNDIDYKNKLMNAPAPGGLPAPSVTVNPGPTNVTVNGGGVGGGKIDPKLLWGGLGALGVLGAGGIWAANRGSNALKEIASQKDKGTLRVTLPTKNPGDEETTIELPMDQINLSQTLEKALKRDALRRLRSESSGRTFRRQMLSLPGTLQQAAA